MRRAARWLPVIVAVGLTALCFLSACSATGALFTPDDAGNTQAGAIAQQAANATGNPLLMAAVGAVNLVVASVLAKKAAKDKDSEAWTEADITSLAAALRAHGYKVERVS